MLCFHASYDDNNFIGLNIGLLQMPDGSPLHEVHDYIYIYKHPLPLGGDWMHACKYGGCAHCMSSECFYYLLHLFKPFFFFGRENLF